MIIKQYIKDFERLGFGMFVHFGLYSIFECGEWNKECNQIPDEEYEKLPVQFDPDPDWAKQLVAPAKNAGCKYITLTTRHHDGFSLYDTCGLNEYDAPHAKCGRDLVREFADECRAQEIIPFFYHTLLDWYEPTYKTDFKAYLKYLRRSVEIICSNYGKIGGIWFDGMWDKKDTDWEEDALYATIRKYQPDAMIINNTGLSARGALGHIELDSVTFERGKPKAINLEDSPKYIASEMCEVLGSGWGYCRDDFAFKAPAAMIESLADCRRFGSNFLLNIGPMGNGLIRPLDAAIFGLLGDWMRYFGESIAALPSGIEVSGRERDFLLKGNDKTYYLFCFGLPMSGDPNVAIFEASDYTDAFDFSECIKSVEWMDNGVPLQFKQENGRTEILTAPYTYGRKLVVRVAKITLS